MKRYYPDSKIAVAQIWPTPDTFGTFIRPTYCHGMMALEQSAPVCQIWATSKPYVNQEQTR